jgi:hypothetical protein
MIERLTIEENLINENLINENLINENPINQNPINENLINENPINQNPINENPINENPINNPVRDNPKEEKSDEDNFDENNSDEDNSDEDNYDEDNLTEENMIEIVFAKYVNTTINNMVNFINMCRKFTSTKHNGMLMAILKINLLKDCDYKNNAELIMKVLTDINDHKNNTRDTFHIFLEEILIDILFNNKGDDDNAKDDDLSLTTNDKIFLYIEQSESPTLFDIYISHFQSNDKRSHNCISLLMRHLYSINIIKSKDFFIKIVQRMIDNKMIDNKMTGWIASKGLHLITENLCVDRDDEYAKIQQQQIDHLNVLLDWFFVLGDKNIKWFYNSTLRYISCIDYAGHEKYRVSNVYFFVKKICEYIKSEESFDCSDLSTHYLKPSLSTAEIVEEFKNISNDQKKIKLKISNNDLINDILIFLCSGTDTYCSYHEIVGYIFKMFEIDENILMTCINHCYKDLWYANQSPVILCEVIKTIYNEYPKMNDYISNSANSFYREIDVYVNGIYDETLIAHYAWLVDNKIISRRDVCERFMKKIKKNGSCTSCMNDTRWRLKKCSHVYCKECFVTAIYFSNKIHLFDYEQSEYCEHCKLLNNLKNPSD